METQTQNIDAALAYLETKAPWRETELKNGLGAQYTAASLSVVKDIERVIQAEFVGTGYHLELWHGPNGSPTTKPIAFRVTSQSGMDSKVKIELRSSLVTVAKKTTFLTSAHAVIGLALLVVQEVGHAIRNDSKYASRGVNGGFNVR